MNPRTEIAKLAHELTCVVYDAKRTVPREQFEELLKMRLGFTFDRILAGQKKAEARP